MALRCRKTLGVLSRILTQIAARLPSSVKYRLPAVRRMYLRAARAGEPLQTITTIHQLSFNWTIDELTHQETLRGTYEKYMQDAFARFAKAGGVALDVGAHNGFHSLLLAAHGMCVIAFEPNPANRTSIERQVALNKNLNVELLPFALSNESKELLLSERGSESQIAEAGIPVVALKLDSLNLKPSLIKIDVEGHEAAALEGGLETLKRCRPVILADFDSHNTIPSLRRILEPLGYTVIEGLPITALP